MLATYDPRFLLWLLADHVLGLDLRHESILPTLRQRGYSAPQTDRSRRSTPDKERNPLVQATFLIGVLPITRGMPRSLLEEAADRRGSNDDRIAIDQETSLPKPNTASAGVVIGLIGGFRSSHSRATAKIVLSRKLALLHRHFRAPDPLPRDGRAAQNRWRHWVSSVVAGDAEDAS